MDPEQGRILAANDAGCTLLGYTRAELLETPISAIHPAELPELSELLERVLRDSGLRRSSSPAEPSTARSCRPRSRSTGSQLDGTLRILGLVQDRSEHRQRSPGR